jgi:hypothetical protein
MAYNMLWSIPGISDNIIHTLGPPSTGVENDFFNFQLSDIENSLFCFQLSSRMKKFFLYKEIGGEGMKG